MNSHDMELQHLGELSLPTKSIHCIVVAKYTQMYSILIWMINLNGHDLTFKLVSTMFVPYGIHFDIRFKEAIS